MSIFSYNGTNYEIITAPKTWAQAKSYAESVNGYLAIVTSQAENDAIFNYALNYFNNAPIADDGGRSKYIWLGGSDISAEGLFKWVNDTIVPLPGKAGYENWGSGIYGAEPDNTGDQQDAMAMGLEAWPAGGGGIGVASEWNDINENNQLFFVVEFNKNSLDSAVTTTLTQDIVNLQLTGIAKINGTGNALDNHLTGNSADNNLYGLAGDDVIDGGLGNDTLVGGQGNDTYYANSAKDKVIEKDNEGTDTVITTVSYTLANYVENLTLSSTANINATGNTLPNVLLGNSGANVLNGGAGKDTLTGGDGSDSFVFSSALNGSNNVDTVTDFVSGKDQLQLSKTIFKAFKAKGALSNEAFYAAANVTESHDTDDRVIYDTASGALYYDADGNGKGAWVQIAVITGSALDPSLSASDIKII